MKTLKKLSIIVAVGLSTIFFSGCSDYLDVSDDLAAELSMEEVFNNTGYARRFHRYIYSGIPDVSNIIITSSYAALTGLDNPWPAVSDELKSAQNNVKTIPTVGYHGVFTNKSVRQTNFWHTRIRSHSKVTLRITLTKTNWQD